MWELISQRGSRLLDIASWVEMSCYLHGKRWIGKRWICLIGTVVCPLIDVEKHADFVECTWKAPFAEYRYIGA